MKGLTATMTTETTTAVDAIVSATATDGAETKAKRLLIQINFDNCPELLAKIQSDAGEVSLPDATFVRQLLAAKYGVELPAATKTRKSDDDGLTEAEKVAVKAAVAQTRKDQMAELRKANADAFKAAAAKAREAALAAIRAPKPDEAESR